MFEAAEAYERDMGHRSNKLAPLFLDWIELKEGDRVLDIGCGTGSLTFRLAESIGAAKVIGVDPSQGFIDHARAQNHDTRVAFDIGNARSLPYADGSFDVCLASLIMGFILDASKAAGEMRRVTRPGGLVATCAIAEMAPGVIVRLLRSNGAPAAPSVSSTWKARLSIHCRCIRDTEKI